MTEEPEFAILPLSILKHHEQINETTLAELMAVLRHAEVLEEPVWVARGSYVILNGHHRVEALRRLGADRIAAWLFDYESDIVQLGRWQPGPPIPKSEVIRRGRESQPFPPKTTRHRILIELPARPTPLKVLFPPRPVAPRRPGHSRAPVRS